jgi:hypothetical protein
MFHRLITKYGLATHLALLASLPLALLPFLSERQLGLAILWLSAFAGLWLLLEPSIMAGEHLSAARARVRHDMVRDPLFWFFFLMVAFAGVRWLNSGIGMQYNPEEGVWSVTKPYMEILPASVGDSGFLPFVVTVGLGVLVQGVLHGLGLSARISFGIMTGFLLGIAGIACVTLVCFEWEPFLQHAKAGLMSGPFYGSFFGLILLMSLMSGIQAESRKWTAARLPFCVAIAGNLAGLLFFAPPALSMCYVAFAVLMTLFSFVHLSRDGALVRVAYSLTMVIFGTALAVCALLSFAPEAVVKAKSEGLDIAAAFPDSYRQTSEILRRISRAMWQESPWSGVGIGAFNLHAKFLAEKADWHVLAPNVSSALNSYWTILAERGILGSLMLASSAVLFLFVWIRNLVQSVKYLHTRDDADVFLFACPSIVWVLPAALALFCVEALFTPVLSCSVTLFAVSALLALSAASFPRAPRSRAATTD